MSFRIGRKTAQHTYPEARRNTTVAYARNSASGPLETQAVSVGVPAQIVWNPIEDGTVAGPNVPITPSATGIIHVTGVITIAAANDTNVQIEVQVNGVTQSVPLTEVVTMAGGVAEGNAGAAIPIDVILGAGNNGPPLPLGVAANVQILVSPTVSIANVSGQSSTLHLQEVSPVTG